MFTNFASLYAGALMLFTIGLMGISFLCIFNLAFSFGALDIESRDKVGNHDSVTLQPDETVSQQPHSDPDTRTTQGRQNRQNNKTAPQWIIQNYNMDYILEY